MKFVSIKIFKYTNGVLGFWGFGVLGFRIMAPRIAVFADGQEV